MAYSIQSLPADLSGVEAPVVHMGRDRLALVVEVLDTERSHKRYGAQERVDRIHVRMKDGSTLHWSTCSPGPTGTGWSYLSVLSLAGRSLWQRRLFLAEGSRQPPSTATGATTTLRQALAG